MKVITFQDARNNRISLCETHIQAHKSVGTWPRGEQGEEMCNVFFGLHDGDCDECAVAA